MVGWGLTERYVGCEGIYGEHDWRMRWVRRKGGWVPHSELGASVVCMCGDSNSQPGLRHCSLPPHLSSSCLIVCARCYHQ